MSSSLHTVITHSPPLRTLATRDKFSLNNTLSKFPTMRNLYLAALALRVSGALAAPTTGNSLPVVDLGYVSCPQPSLPHPTNMFFRSCTKPCPIMRRLKFTPFPTSDTPSLPLVTCGSAARLHPWSTVPLCAMGLSRGLAPRPFQLGSPRHSDQSMNLQPLESSSILRHGKKPSQTRSPSRSTLPLALPRIAFF